MKKLNFEKFAANKIGKNELTKLRGGDHAETHRSDGSQDWRDCGSGEVVDANGNTIGKGTTGGSNCY